MYVNIKRVSTPGLLANWTSWVLLHAVVAVPLLAMRQLELALI